MTIRFSREGPVIRTTEHQLLAEYRQRISNWKNWGVLLSEQAWGTVREDYSDDGTAWDFPPMITLAVQPTAGMKTVWPASATAISTFALRWPCRTGGIEIAAGGAFLSAGAIAVEEWLFLSVEQGQPSPVAFVNDANRHFGMK